MDPHLGPRLRLLTVALLFSTGGAAIKACDLDTWQVASFRSGIAALAVLAMAPEARRRWSWRVAAVGTTYAATMILFVAANKLTTAANAIFLQSTAPVYVVLLGPWLLREPLRRRDLLFLAVMAAGLALFFVGAPPVYASAPHPARGNLLSLLSGLCWAFTVIGLRWIGRDEATSAGATAATCVAGNVIAFAACLPLALPVVGSDANDWLVVSYLGVFQIGLAYVLLSRAIPHVPALEASLLLLVEPAFNPLWAWAVHGEVPGLWPSLGGALILGATALKATLDYRSSRLVRV